MARTITRTPDPSPQAARRLDAESAAAIAVGFNRAPRTELGRALFRARQAFLAEHGRFLTDVELAREIAERRGGVTAL